MDSHKTVSTNHNLSEEKGKPKRYRTEGLPLTNLKPVLKWANVCSSNILQTVRRTMIRFLIELLVRRTWFGQFDKLSLRSQLACNEMQNVGRKCRLKSSPVNIL